MDNIVKQDLNAARQLRRVQRAVLELRQGVPVLLRDREGSFVVMAAETANEAGLAEFRVVLGGKPVIVLAAGRAAGLGMAANGDQAVALGMNVEDLGLDLLAQLTDPTAAQELTAGIVRLVPTPQAGQVALRLAKLGRLLPAVLMGKIEPGRIDDLLVVDAQDIIEYQALETEALTRTAQARVPLAEAADVRIVAFRPGNGGIEHLAVLIGSPETAMAPLARIHSECFTGDVLGSLRCDCGPQLHEAIRRMRSEGAGVLLYMAQEGRGIGLVNKLRAYALQDRGLDTVDANRALGFRADERHFEPAAVMLRALGLTRVRLLTNNPEKLAGLTAYGIEIWGRENLAIAANGTNDHYLATKIARFGHLID